MAGYALAGRGFDTHGAKVVAFTLQSSYTGRAMHELAVLPAHAGRGRPLLVLLHWRGSKPRAMLSNQLFSALAALGPRAPIVLLPDGGRWSFWHDRRGARWAHYVVDEVIPAGVRRFGADPSRVAIGGISMGGFGALNIGRLWPGRFCAVGAHSPAIFTSFASELPRAFDSRADFARNNLLALRPSYRGTPVWIDVGASDRFRAADVRLAHELGVTPHVWPGGHRASYWRSHMADYLRFYANALARC